MKTNSEAVKDCVKWLKNKIKKEKIELEKCKQNERDFGMFDDCGDSYREDTIRQEERIKTMVDIMISLDKYSKKLKHEENEYNEQ